MRLVPKVTVVTTTIRASTVPTMTDRTGTELRPLRPSRANRTPSTAGSGRPQPAATPAAVESCPGDRARREASRSGASRTANPTAITPSTTMRTATPAPSTTQSHDTPRSG